MSDLTSDPLCIDSPDKLHWFSALVIDECGCRRMCAWCGKPGTPVELDEYSAEGNQELNQCDGCRRGLPVDENGNHKGPGGFWAGDMQACTADRYTAEGKTASTTGESK